MPICRYGFRIVGDCTNPRRLVDAGVAFAAYAECDERAELERESYLSAFCFGRDFRGHLESTGSTAGFDGECWSDRHWFDIDAEGDLAVALNHARRLLLAVCDRYKLSDDEPLIFFSGSKGFHIGLPTAIWRPEPSRIFNRIARRFAERAAELAGVTIDLAIYDKVRAFRAPNSRHPRTGRCKRRLTADELMHLSVDAVLRMAEQPAPFEIPDPAGFNGQAAADWREATEHVEREVSAARNRETNGGAAHLNRATLEFIRQGATVGDRHRLLFSAAANLAEFDCPEKLAHALLTDAALDSGLAPREVHRQIECGLNHKSGGT